MSSVPTSTGPCAYPPLFDLNFFHILFPDKRSGPTRDSLLLAHLCFFGVCIEISQIFIMTALKIYLARRGFSLRDRHRNTAHKHRSTSAGLEDHRKSHPNARQQCLVW